MHKNANDQIQPEETPAATEEQAIPVKVVREVETEPQAVGTEASEDEVTLDPTPPEEAEAEEAEEEEEEVAEAEVVDEEEEEAEDDVETQLEEKDEEIERLRNQILRARADLENFRRRTEREKQESLRFANRNIFSSVLDVLDNFDRALLSATDPTDNFVIGVSMIHKQLTEVLTQNGVEEIATDGRVFDPYLDEAIAKEPSSEFEENTIMEVFQKGYRYHGSLLRPTKVKVASAPETKQETEEASEETLTE